MPTMKIEVLFRPLDHTWSVECFCEEAGTDGEVVRRRVVKGYRYCHEEACRLVRQWQRGYRVKATDTTFPKESLRAAEEINP